MMTQEEISNIASKLNAPIAFTVDSNAALLLTLFSQLQLALRHPENPQDSARIARDFARKK